MYNICGCDAYYNLQLFPSVAMILGFGDRRQTREADVLPGNEQLFLDILITSLRTSELFYPVGVRSVIEGQPIIDPMDFIQNFMFDGLFGSREQNTINNLVLMESLEVNTTMLPALQVSIRDDFLPENLECFELSIFRVDVESFTEQFMCNTAGDNFFCEHEICILDDDG